MLGLKSGINQPLKSLKNNLKKYTCLCVLLFVCSQENKTTQWSCRWKFFFICIQLSQLHQLGRGWLSLVLTLITFPPQVQIILTLVLLSLSVLLLSLRSQRSLSAAVTHSGRHCRGKKRGSRCIVPCGCRSLRRSTRVPRWMWSCQGSWEWLCFL